MTNNVMVWILTILLLTLGTKALIGSWDLLGLDLVWPPTFCSITPCQAIKDEFTIQSLVPLYSTPTTEVPVPSYSIEPRCTNVEPVEATSITQSSFGNFLTVLGYHWPNLQWRKNAYYNIEYLRNVWDVSDKCYGYRHPRGYFQDGIDLYKGLNNDMLDILKAGEIKDLDDHDGYDPRLIQRAIHDGLKVYATLFCETNQEGDVLLSTIRICFDKDLNIISCTNKFHLCSSKSGLVKFPAAPRANV